MATIVMTWNLENLFQPQASAQAEVVAVYQRKVAALADVIRAAEADVVAVQEVGDPAAAGDLAAAVGAGWQVLLSTRFEPRRGIRVGVLSRLPAREIAQADAFPDQLGPVRTNDNGASTSGMGRGVLAVEVTTTDGPLTVVSVHLKSKLLSFPGPGGTTRFSPRDETERARYAAYALHRRAAEAVTVRALVDDLLAGAGRTRRLIVAGDLNDEPSAATTQILHGPPGSEIGTAGYDRPDTGDAHRLWNLAPHIPEKQRFSRVYRGRGELIDHLLVSHALLTHVDRVRTIGPGQLASIDDDPTSRRLAEDSDHAPVLAHLTS